MLWHIGRKRIAARAALCTGVLFVFVEAAYPQGTTQIEYAVKFVCGIPGVEVQREAVKLANYATAINIHNPNQLPTTPAVTFTKHVVLALPEGTTQRPPFLAVSDKLASDHALEVDCRTIWDLIKVSPDSPFVKGFLIILTPSPNTLDVVGVYSAAPLSSTGAPPAGISIEVVPVTPKTVTK
jgi:hypothetical protein